MGRLLLLFVLLPAVELALLIELGSRIGTLATLALIAVTGVVGASLARRQGIGVLRTLQAETAAGRLPAAPLTDGVLILIAGALLVTPGILTDAAGFLCLVPAFRRWLRGAVRRRFERAVREGRVEVRLTTDDLFGEERGVREPRDERVVRDVREPRDERGVRDVRDLRDERGVRDVRDLRDERGVRDVRDLRDERGGRDVHEPAEPGDRGSR